MRRHRLMALIGLLLLAGCSGDDARSLGPVPTAPTTTTTEPVTSTTSTTTATSVAPRPAASATTSTAAPRLVNGTPQVTVGASRCQDIAFAPNSDNLASDIVATGVTCAEAEALVRKVGPQVGAIGGPSRVEADGWVCIRTASNDRFLPNSDFACTSGSKTVTFHRT